MSPYLFVRRCSDVPNAYFATCSYPWQAKLPSRLFTLMRVWCTTGWPCWLCCSDTVFKSLHSEEWVRETRSMLDPEFDRHFALRGSSPFWQGGPESGRVAMAPGFQAFEWSPFGERLMDDVACNTTILDFAEMVMGPFVQLDSCEITGYEGAGSDNQHATGWHRDGFDTSTVWNNNNENLDNGLEWRPGTSSRAMQSAAKVPATRRHYTPPLACNYLTYLQSTDGSADNPGLRVIPGSHRDYSSAISVDGSGRTLDNDPRVRLLCRCR